LLLVCFSQLGLLASLLAGLLGPLLGSLLAGLLALWLASWFDALLPFVLILSSQSPPALLADKAWGHDANQ
jgi:hypothetical protein